MKQKRGLGLTYQRGSKWWIQYSVRGVRHREAVPTRKDGSSHHADAVELLKQKIADVKGGKAVGNVVTKTTLGDLTTMLNDDYRANRRHSNIKAAIVHLHEFFGADVRACDITSERITSYRAQRQEKIYHGKPVASATINLELALLRRAFHLARKAGKVAGIPEFSLFDIGVTNARKGFFERDQFMAVVEQLPDFLKPVAEAGYYSGWREGEVVTRQWRHVDFNAGWLRLDPGETKNSEGRNFPFALIPEFRAVIEAQRKRVTEIEKATGQIIPWVFCRDNGVQVNSRTGAFHRTWIAACKRAGVSGRLFHDFRRTAVRNLERAGVSRSQAMKMTGHKTESVYRRYAIVSESDLQEAAAKLATLYASETTTAAKPPKVVAIKS